jgi:hypothetical protein
VGYTPGIGGVYTRIKKHTLNKEEYSFFFFFLDSLSLIRALVFLGFILSFLSTNLNSMPLIFSSSFSSVSKNFMMSLFAFVKERTLQECEDEFKRGEELKSTCSDLSLMVDVLCKKSN